MITAHPVPLKDLAPPTMAYPEDPPVLLQQSHAYAKTLIATGQLIEPFELRNHARSIGHALIMRRRYMGGLFRLTAILRGPVWYGDISDDDKIKALRALIKRVDLKRRTAITPLDRGTSTALTQMGWRRVKSGESTVLIDLTEDEETIWKNMDGNWRTAIRRAKEAPFEIYLRDDPETLNWLVKQERRQQKRAGYYRGLPRGFEASYRAQNDGSSLLLLTAEHLGAVIGATLFFIHGSTATYHIGWSHPKGRTMNVHNHLIWTAMKRLGDRGVTTLDLAGVDTQTSPGLARFKLGTGGHVHTFPGAFMPPLLAKF
mgnify:CR=1 FL=1